MFPNQALELTDLTTGQGLGTTFGPTGGTPDSAETWTVGADRPRRPQDPRHHHQRHQPQHRQYHQPDRHRHQHRHGRQQQQLHHQRAATAAAGRRDDLHAGDRGPEGDLQRRVHDQLDRNALRRPGLDHPHRPLGHRVPQPGARLTDLTTGQGLGTTFGPTGGTPNSAETWTVGETVPAGHKIRATITNVTNPNTASTGNRIAIDTSTDTGANSNTYTTSAGFPVTVGDVTLSNPSAGASGVTYAVEFTTSASGRLADQGAIALTAPAGTTFPNQALSLFDVTTGQGVGTTFNPGATGAA